MDSRKRRLSRIALFTVLFILLFLLIRFTLRTPVDEGNPLFPDSSAAARTGEPAASAPRDTTPAVAVEPVHSAAHRPQAEAPTAKPRDTVTAVVPVLPSDKTPPLVQADPGPGIHPAPIAVRLFADEPAEITYHLNSDTAWRRYEAPIEVRDSLFLVFRGRDSTGNLSEPVARTYVIHKNLGLTCPQDMVPVTVKGAMVCIDRFEWPNRKGATPLAYINWYMAYDSCRTYKKRLCTASEWEAACGGINGTEYPYGPEYERKTCNTETDNPAASGARPECRSYFGAYDLSGNVREWTSTKSERNDRHYQVYGGYWENRGASKCRSTQYSFFPENKFVSVGFRCCKDPEVK